MVAGLGATLVTLGVGLNVVAGIVGGLATLFTAATTAVAALLSPLGLTSTAIATLAGWFLTSTETGRMMADQLTSFFGELYDIAKETIGGIATLLAAGKIEEAGNLLWAGLELLWLKGTQKLRNIWHQFTGRVLKLWNSAVIGLATTMTNGWASIQNVWDLGTTTIANVFDVVMAAIRKSWNSTLAFFETTWERFKSLFGVDVAGEIDRINAELRIANRSIDREIDASIGARTTASEQRRAGRNANADSIVGILADDLERRLGNVDSQTEQRIRETEQAVKDAQAAWQAANKAADAIRDVADKDARARAAGLNLTALDFAGSAAAITSSIQPQAIFDTTFAGQQFGRGVKDEINLLDRVANATEKTNKKLEPGVPVT